MERETELFTIPVKWLTAKWIAFYLVLGFTAMFLVSAAIKRSSDASDLRSCVADLRNQTTLPRSWVIQTCKLGDWSGDFDASVLAPPYQDPQVAFDAYKTVNVKPGSKVEVQANGLLITDGDRYLSISRDEGHSCVYLISLRNSK